MTYDQALSALTRGTPVARLLRYSGITPSTFRAKCERSSLQAQIYSDVNETLKTFVAEKIPLGIVTSLPGWMAHPILDGLRISDYLDGVIDYGSTSRHKPYPEPLLAALEMTGLSPSTEVWYVGDTEGDCTAAKTAGLSFACALYGYGNTFDGADAYLTEFSEIQYL
jgi:phosphoglycolate phosphatase